MCISLLLLAVIKQYYPFYTLSSIIFALVKVRQTYIPPKISMNVVRITNMMHWRSLFDQLICS